VVTHSRVLESILKSWLLWAGGKSLNLADRLIPPKKERRFGSKAEAAWTLTCKSVLNTLDATLA
jgi:hypothetical protein